MNFYEKLAYRMGQKKAEDVALSEDEALPTTEDVEGAGGYGLSPKRMREVYDAVWTTPDIDMTPEVIKNKHRNMWIGAGLGGVGGAGLGAFLAHQLPNARLGEHIGGGLAGAVLGTVLGAGLGYGRIPTTKEDELREVQQTLDHGNEDPLIASLAAAADRLYQIRQRQKTSSLQKLALTPGLGDQTYYESPTQKLNHPKPSRPLVPKAHHNIQPASEPRGVAGTALY